MNISSGTALKYTKKSSFSSGNLSRFRICILVESFISLTMRGKMKKNLQKIILGYEAVGFAIVMLIIWLDEVVDIPYLFLGARKTPVNWQESLFESTCIFILGIFVLRMTFITLKQLKHLEGFLPVCSFCKKIRIGSEWIQLEKYITEHSEAVFSHSLCPECTEEHYGDILRKGQRSLDDV